MKKHTTKEGKKGVRCDGLKKTIPPGVWSKGLLPYYTMDAPLPDLSEFVKKATGRSRGEFSAIGLRRNKKRRLSNDREIGCHGTPRLPFYRF